MLQYSLDIDRCVITVEEGLVMVPNRKWDVQCFCSFKGKTGYLIACMHWSIVQEVGSVSSVTRCTHSISRGKELGNCMLPFSWSMSIENLVHGKSSALVASVVDTTQL